MTLRGFYRAIRRRCTTDGTAELPAKHASESWYRWLEVAALVGVTVGGIYGLGRFARHVASPKAERNISIINPSEVVSLWLHPALYELATGPDAAAVRSYGAFRRYAEEHALERVWYVFTVRAIESDGKAVVIHTIRKPYELGAASFSEVLDVLATVAGHPPSRAITDFSTAAVRIIPDRLLGVEPRKALDELQRLEHLPETEREGGGVDLRGRTHPSSQPQSNAAHSR